MSKRSLAYLFIVLLLIVVTIPFVIGWQIKKHFDQYLALLSENYQLNFIAIDSKQSWLHSDVVLATNFPLADQVINKDSLTKQNALFLKLRIHHGPIIYYQHNDRQSIKFALALIEAFLEPNYYIGTTTISFTTAMKTALSIPHYRVQQNNKTVYEISNFAGMFNVPAHKNSFTANLTLGDLAANFEMKRRISGLRVSYKQIRNNSGLWTGTKHYHFNSLSWQQGGYECQFQDLHYDIAKQPLNNYVKIAINGTVKSAIINHVDYGPQHIALTLTGLDGKELQKTLTANQNGLSNLAELNRLFTGLRVTINDIALKTAWGPVTIKGTINCSSLQKTCISELFKTTQGNLEGYLPEEVLSRVLKHYYLTTYTPDEILADKKTQEVLENWHSTGLLLKQGDEFSLHFAWDKKQ